MGVPYLFKWIRENLTPTQRLILDHVPGEIFSLSFDLNGLIHQACQITYGYGKYHDEKRIKATAKMKDNDLYSEFEVTFKTLLNTAITTYNPVEQLIITVDGKAPVAKIQQQGRRRFRSSISTETNPKFDSNSISPGTEFMKKVDITIRNFIEEQRENLPPMIIYSPHDQIGEGEHKIMDIYRRMKQTQKDGGGNSAAVKVTKTSTLPKG